MSCWSWITSQDVEGRLISPESEIVPGADDLRAVDVFGRFAALFRFGVGQGGGWSSDRGIAIEISLGREDERRLHRGRVRSALPT